MQKTGSTKAFMIGQSCENVHDCIKSVVDMSTAYRLQIRNILGRDLALMVKENSDVLFKLVDKVAAIKIQVFLKLGRGEAS